MIKNLEKLKEYNIICTNTDEVKECLDILEKLGFKTEKKICPNEMIVKNFRKNFFSTCFINIDYKNINFYNFKKQTKKFLKKIEEELPDFEVAEDGRITKINNYRSNKTIYIEGEEDSVICLIDPYYLRHKVIELGKAFKNLDVKNRAEEKRKIYIQLKNLAERLNNGEKFDWNDTIQKKYYLYYDYKEKKLSQGFNSFSQKINTVYCLSPDFLEIAEKEIGEENLLKLFED